MLPDYCLVVVVSWNDWFEEIPMTPRQGHCAIQVTLFIDIWTATFRPPGQKLRIRLTIKNTLALTSFDRSSRFVFAVELAASVLLQYFDVFRHFY
jgi:hypothetical protein